MYYYRIFDDKDELNFFKSSFEYSKIQELIKEYEKTNQEYVNPDFIGFLKKQDSEAEIIDVTNIYY